MGKPTNSARDQIIIAPTVSTFLAPTVTMTPGGYQLWRNFKSLSDSFAYIFAWHFLNIQSPHQPILTHLPFCCSRWTHMVSSLPSTISTRSKNHDDWACELSCRILSFFNVPRSTAEMEKMSSCTLHQTMGSKSPNNKLSFSQTAIYTLVRHIII